MMKVWTVEPQKVGTAKDGIFSRKGNWVGKGQVSYFSKQGFYSPYTR